MSKITGIINFVTIEVLLISLKWFNEHKEHGGIKKILFDV